MDSKETIAENQERTWKRIWNMTDEEWDRAWSYLEAKAAPKVTASGASPSLFDVVFRNNDLPPNSGSESGSEQES